MITCNVCNRKFKQVSNYIVHLNREIKNGCPYHNLERLNYFSAKVKSVFPNLEVLNVSYAHGRPYVQIFNSKCGHSSILRLDHIITNFRQCSHKECVSKIKSQALLGKAKSDEHRKHIREATQTTDYRSNMSKVIKEKFSDPSFVSKHKQGIYNSRLTHANGIAKWQRRKKSGDELLVMSILRKENINFVYQYPLVTDTLEIVFDFYLPDYSTYINVDTDPYHNLDNSSNSESYLSRASYVINKDKLLRESFNKNEINGNLIQLKNVNDLINFIKLLKGGDANGKS